jgi:hypothetical protein
MRLDRSERPSPCRNRRWQTASFHSLVRISSKSDTNRIGRVIGFPYFRVIEDAQVVARPQRQSNIAGPQLIVVNAALCLGYVTGGAQGTRPYIKA